MPFEECYASLERHITQAKLGMIDEDHLAHAICNLNMLIHFEEMIKLGLLPVDLDNMPKYLQQKRKYPQQKGR